MYQEIKDFKGVVETDAIQKNGAIVMRIPFDTRNTDYQAYLQWLALGNTPLSAE